MLCFKPYQVLNSSIVITLLSTQCMCADEAVSRRELAACVYEIARISLGIINQLDRLRRVVEQCGSHQVNKAKQKLDQAI